MALPEITTPSELAKTLGWSERRVKQVARGLGACCVLGRTMILTSKDVRAIKAISVLDVLSTGETLPRQEYGGTYFIDSGDAIKIGFSSNWNKRLASLQTSSPSELKVLAVYYGPRSLELELHKKFAEYRIRQNGEWFRKCDAISDYIEENKNSCLFLKGQ